jgi:choline dehydrogenase-like flavoprotein
MRSLRAAINHRGFYVPPVPPIRQKTNSHYVGTLPYAGPLVEVLPSSEAMPGVYICDSACFPASPAVNPTFTIMANALRIATEVLDG